MILEVTEVDQSFRVGFWMSRVQILHGVSLKIPARSIYGFLGANGAGKTTLIHLIAGLRKPFRGSVKVSGFEATSREARSRTGYLPERPYFYEHLTGRDLLRYFGALSGLPRPQVLERIPRVLSTVGMSHAGNLELRKYSKGMLQRIGIAQAILHDPEFLVLDEPMSGLDPLGRKEMRDLITGLASEGRTIFFSTHVIPDVEAICDQIALIQKGRLIGCGPIGQFLNQGPGQTEIAFHGVPLEKVEKIASLDSVRQIPDGIRAMVPQSEKVSEVLNQVLKLGAKVLWVTPIRPSLESFFHKSDEGSPPVGSSIDE